MYQSIVMTCGISLISGFNLFSVMNKESYLFNCISKDEFHSTTITPEMAKKMDQYLKKANELLDQIDDHPHKISAEFSMIHALQKRKKIKEGIEIILIYTDTFGGQVCKQLLTTIFEKKFQADVKHLPINIAIKSEKEIRNQLPDYLSKLSNALIQRDPSSTCFAPIGGYKVMTSYGYIIGSFLQFPTAYLHEDSQVLIEIPPVPIDINEDFINEHASLLRKCQKDYTSFNDLSYLEQQIVNTYPSIFTVEEGFVVLSPFGEFLAEYKYLKSFTEIRLSEQVEKMKIDNKHESELISQQIRVLIKKLKCGESDEHLYHERSFKDLDRKKIRFHLYKGQNQFRLAYKYDEKEDILYANYLWLDHDKYENEAKRGIGIYKEETFDFKKGGKVHA